MKEITMFIQGGCPHCMLAERYVNKLQQDPRYAGITVHEIDERRQVELANSYDYWLVPSFYIGREKLHEGHAEYADVKAVFDAALTS